MSGKKKARPRKPRAEKDLGGINTRERERRRMFVALYTHPDYARNGKRAAEDAGYSPKSAKVQAHRLLNDPDVVEAINATIAQQMERTRISSDIIVTELAKVGRANLRDVLEVRMEKKGRSLKPALYLKAGTLDQLHPDVAAAIRELEVTKDGIRVRMHDKMQALALLSKHQGGQFRDPMSLPQRPVYTPEERLVLMIGMLKLLAARSKEPQEIPA